MIDPEGYICDYYEMNRDYLSQLPKMKYQNLNFSKLSPERKLAQVKISLMLNDKLIIKEKIDWDLQEDKKSPHVFAKHFVEKLKDVIEPDLIEYNINNIKNQILDGLLEHIDKNTYIPKLRLAKKENENNQSCLNCDSVIFNQEYCVNCMFIFEKKVEKKPIVEPILDEFRQTERQRILELRQKNVNIEDLALSYSETKDKKVCKKCGEINLTTAVECKNCKYKFPFLTYFDKSVNQSYSVHFWDRINRNSTVQQLKNFGEFFRQEDFCSLKFLYNKIKSLVRKEYEEILTEEAYEDLIYFLEKSYFAFSNPTITSERVFDSAYYNKFSKARPRNRMMNFNSLNDIKEGWLNDTLPDKNVEELREEKVRVVDPNLKKKRGRPKKMEIFKAEQSKFNDIQITLAERDNLLKTDFIPEEDVHFDFCGKCEEEGKLICCETCSSAYHFECLGYDRFPRGKYKCYYCKIVKSGIDEALTVDKKQMKLIKKLITYNRKSKWFNKAEEFLEVIESHHCSAFFRQPVPVDFQEFHSKIKESKDMESIKELLINGQYRSLKDFIKDLANLWSNFKFFYKPPSFFYKLADTMEIFMTHLIKEEGVFDTYEPDEERNSLRKDRAVKREKIEIEDLEEESNEISEEDENVEENDCHIDLMEDDNQ